MSLTFDETDFPEEGRSPEEAAYQAVNDINPDASADVSPYRCEDCGSGLVYAGRGRKPKRCRPGEGCRVNSIVQGVTRKRSSGRQGWQEPLRNALAGNFASIGMVVFALNRVDGQAILSGSPRLADSLIQVAEQEPKVRKALENMVTAGAWSGVAMSVAAIAVPIMANHGYLPPGFIGAQPEPQPQPQPDGSGMGW